MATARSALAPAPALNRLAGHYLPDLAARTFVTKRGFLRSGVEILLVGSLAAVVAFGVGALAASFA